MSKFGWEKKKVGGKEIFQVTIDGHPIGNPCKNEEEANATVTRLEREERQRKIDRDSGIEP
jgi:hypothetical protein